MNPFQNSPDIGQLLSFSSDGAEAIRREITVEDPVPFERDLPDKELIDQFELERCSEWIQEHNYEKTCLQFPDNLLKFSSRILFLLESMIHKRLYILADSTYGSCCIDEKTAKHISGDSLIHFGQSCLTETNNTIPVLYIFTKPNLRDEAMEKLSNVFQSNFQECPNVNILILYDVIYQQIAQDFHDLVAPVHKNLILSKLVLPGNSDTDTKDAESNHITLYGRRVPSDPISIDQVFYIGTNSRTILNFLLSPTCSGKPFAVYNPITKSVEQESSSAQKLTKLRMKRTYYIEKLKDSNSVGILVGTLAVEKYLAIIDHMKNILRQANKKVYTVAIGEITPPKLANFPDIQIFVLISCPECTILDSKEFFQPIVTPYEVELAFNQDREWAVNIVNDFRVLLPGGNLHTPLKMDQDSTDVSLLTGEFRGLNTQNAEPLYWQGLNINEESNQSGVMEGKSGIPRNYISEPKK